MRIGEAIFVEDFGRPPMGGRAGRSQAKEPLCRRSSLGGTMCAGFNGLGGDAILNWRE